MLKRNQIDGNHSWFQLLQKRSSLICSQCQNETFIHSFGSDVTEKLWRRYSVQ